MSIISVIEYQPSDSITKNQYPGTGTEMAGDQKGNNDILIYKFPGEEFNTNSKLIVRPSQEAIFIRGGEMADSFPPGTYTLKTGNLPILGKLINLPTGGVSPFQASVYFVNKTMAWDMKWGIPHQERYLDPVYKMRVKASASGTMAIQISDARKFLERMVGQTNYLTKADLQDQFRSIIITKVKRVLSQLLRNFGFEVMNEYLEELSETLYPEILEEMKTYGVSLQKFVIDRIKLDDDDIAKIDKEITENYSRRAELQRKKEEQLQQIELEVYRRKQEADANAYKTRTEGTATTDVEADRMRREGYSFRDAGIIEVLKRYAANEHTGGGGVMDGVSQIPMAIALGSTAAGAATSMFQGFGKQMDDAAGMFRRKDNNGTFPNPAEEARNNKAETNHNPLQDEEQGINQSKLQSDEESEVESNEQYVQSVDTSEEAVPGILNDELSESDNLDEDLTTLLKPYQFMLDEGIITKDQYDVLLTAGQHYKPMLDEGVITQDQFNHMLAKSLKK